MVCSLCLLPLLVIFCRDGKLAACWSVGAGRDLCSSVGAWGCRASPSLIPNIPTFYHVECGGME